MLDVEEKNANAKGDGAPSEQEPSKLFVPDVPGDVIFPEELNTYLRDQIQYLTHENGRLEKNLSDKEIKLQHSLSRIQNLNKQMQSYDNASPTGTAATGKIVQVSKKLRDRSAELETMKTKYSKLERQLFDLQQRERSEKTPENVPEKEKPPNELEEQIKQLQDRLNAATNKLFETKNANYKLKNELKLANRCVQKEIGDTLLNITAGGSNWRGRAQIICDLQQKNNDLKEKLKAYQCNKPTDAVLQIKPDRRLEFLSRENSVLKSELHEVRRRLEGARARSKLVESECSVLRAKVVALNEQQDNDRNLIATLTSRLPQSKCAHQDDRDRHKDMTIRQLERDYKSLHLELIKERCRFENLQKEKDLEIQELKDASTRSTNELGNLVDAKLVDRLEAERGRLLELTKSTTKRLETERDSYQNLQQELRLERQRAARLEVKISRLELERSSKAPAYTSPNSRMKEGNYLVEDRLALAEETIKVLQSRLEIERREKQMDFEEFAHILQNYRPIEFESQSN